MTLEFPSREFDDVVAAVCHDSASDEQVRALNELLRANAAARDEYILRLELHSRLASEPSFFQSPEPEVSVFRQTSRITPLQNFLSDPRKRRGRSVRTGTIALAACLVLLAVGIWSLRPSGSNDQTQPTSKAVAMLNRTADALWNRGEEVPRLNAPLEPGWLRLEAGLAQVIFYSGTRVVIEGPAELQLISRNEAYCRRGRLIVEAPTQAGGFLLKTPHSAVTDLGKSIGLEVKDQRTDLHAFKGNVKVKVQTKPEQVLQAGASAMIESEGALVAITANSTAFATLFDLQARSVASEARRYDQWRTECKRLERDASLLLHFGFENVSPSDWQIRNLGKPDFNVSDATIVGCQWTEGRWPEKRALEFQSVSDRVRLNVPGEFQSVTLAAWVSVKGLDRKINSLLMSDGFDPGTIHWLIRRDGVLGLTVIGEEPRNHQIVASPPVVTLEKFGMWLHLAVVLDSNAGRVIHYVNGVPVSEKALQIAPPFRIGAAELGNWNAKGFPKNDPFMIRNFSGAIDEFCVFNRTLDTGEIRALYIQGKPQADTLATQADSGELRLPNTKP